MKKSFILLPAAAALFMFPSCRKVTGEGPVQSELRTITDFSGVSSGIGGRVNYTIAPQFKVELIAQRNILDVLETSKVDGHLLIKTRTGVQIRSNEDIVVNISAPTAGYLHQSGAGSLMITGNIVSQNFDMGISGSGNIFADKITTNKINATISGSGNIHIKEGSADEEGIRISGSGKIKMENVYAKKAVVNISGSGSMYLNLSQTLDASISGSGSVFYHGSALVNVHISGSGKVIRL
jgi:hypothetical protein